MKRKNIFSRSVKCIFSAVCCTVFAVNSAFSGISLKAEAGVSLSEVSPQEVVLTEENAVLQKYSMEDIIATQAFILNRPYEGVGRVIDADNDGIVDVYDICIMRKDHSVSGNYYQLLEEMIKENNEKYSVTLASGEVYSNRVMVRADTEYDFTEYDPIAVLYDSDYRYILQFDKKSKTEFCCNDLQDKEHIIYAEIDITVPIPDYDETAEKAAIALASDEEHYSWGTSVIESDKLSEHIAENYTNSITVAVIDSGIAKHKFLDGRIDYNAGMDFVRTDGKSDPSYDELGHGTHVAGIIVDNTQGLDISIVPIKVFGDNPPVSIVNSAIRYAVNIGVDVINLSLVSTKSRSMQDEVRDAVKRGVVVVAAAGNNNTGGSNRSADTEDYTPSDTGECIVVSAVRNDLKIYAASSYGKTVDMCAPGVNVRSSTNDGSFGKKTGTSMAAPHITAAAAMVRYMHPSYSPEAVEKELIGTCEDIGAKGFDVYFGNGIPRLSKLIKDIEEPTIALSAESADIFYLDKYPLTASVTPTNAAVSWTSSDTSVATVSDEGVVTANGVGTATVTASFSSGGKKYSASCTVNVKKPTIKLGEVPDNFYIGDSFYISCKKTPSNCIVTWSTNNTNVLSVSNGKVIGVGAGTAQVIARIEYNGKRYTAAANVVVDSPRIRFNKYYEMLGTGETFTIAPTVYPEESNIIWSSSDYKVANVQGGKVTARNPGRTIITGVMSHNNDTYYDVCIVDVGTVGIEFDRTSKALSKGDEFKLQPTVYPSTSVITWASSNTAVATVSNGKVKAVGSGTAVITASMTYKNTVYNAECTVTVNNTGIKLNRSSISVYPSETFILEADTIPPGMSITWISSNNSVVSVVNGVVTAKSAGTAAITAKVTYQGESYTAICDVTVKKPNIVLDKTQISLYQLQSANIIATVDPSDTKVTWSTSDPGVVIAENGRISAVSPGTATVTASIVVSGTTYSAKCVVTVKEAGIKLSASSKTLYESESFDLTATVKPSGSGGSLKWSSSNPSVATVNDGRVNAMGEGTAVIRASYSYDGIIYTTTCIVTVVQPSIELSVYSKSLTKDSTFTITPKNYPTGVKVNWISSDSNIASVSNGKVTAVGGGTAKIRAYFIFDNVTYYSEPCVVSVTAPSISLSRTSCTLNPSEQLKLSSTVYPTGLSVTWSTSNSSVAVVDKYGNITAVSAGTATITASMTSDGKTYSAECKVTVTDPVLILDASSRTLYPSKFFSITASTSPSGQTITWKTSDKSVATVSNGLVTAINPGTATITASFTLNGRTYSSKCNVTVLSPSITLDEDFVELDITQSKVITADVAPSGRITWSSSDKDVAIVSDGKITAVGEGIADIIATLSYDGKTYKAVCEVSVNPPTITLDQVSKKCYPSQYFTITAKTVPNDEKGTITWKTSNKSVATVTNGFVTAISPGAAVITATYEYNGKKYSAECSVRVEQPGIRLDTNGEEIKVNETYVLKATVAPSDRAVTWSSSDPNVAIVTDGKVVGAGVGTATITATMTYDGKKYTATCIFDVVK